MSDKYKMMNSIINGTNVELQGYSFDHFISRPRFEQIFNLKQLYSPLYQELCKIKNNPNLTTFEFISDENNWLTIQNHFSLNKENNFEISDDTLNLFYNFLTSSLFSLDFNEAFHERIACYKSKNEKIYDARIESEEPSIFHFFGDDFTVSAKCYYHFHPIDDKKMVFSINKDSESNQFSLDMELHYQGLRNIKPENKLYKKYTSRF